MISYLLASQKPRPFIIGISLAFLVITPWWIRNLIHFGSPTFSTQQFAAAGYTGYIRWEEGTYTLLFRTRPAIFCHQGQTMGHLPCGKKQPRFFRSIHGGRLSISEAKQVSFRLIATKPISSVFRLSWD